MTFGESHVDSLNHLAVTNHLAQKFNFTYRFIDYVLCVNNSKISEIIDLIYPCELELKDTTESNTSASYLDCCLCIDNGKPVTRLYDKRDDFNLSIVNFPIWSSNPAGIWCQNDVVLTSMRRHHVASTSIRRHFGTKCPLGIFLRHLHTEFMSLN